MSVSATRFYRLGINSLCCCFFEVDVVVVVIVVVVVYEIRRTVKAHPERTTQLSR